MKPAPHLAVLLKPVNGAMQLVEVQELVEASYATFGNLARIIDIEPVNRGIEAGNGTAGESIEVLDTEKFEGLLEEGIVVQREKVGSAEVAVARATETGEKR